MTIPGRAAWVVLALVAATVPCVAQEAPVVAPKPVASDHEMRHQYVWSTLGLDGAIHATLSSGLDQWRASPPEWGGGTKGYAKRWASEFGGSAVGNTTKYLVARLFHHDPSFTRCACTGFATRLGHAAGSPFMARTRRGRRVLSPAIVAGMLAGHVVPASTWYPPRGARDGMKHAATGIAGKIGVAAVREFWPRRTRAQ